MQNKLVYMHEGGLIMVWACARLTKIQLVERNFRLHVNRVKLTAVILKTERQFSEPGKLFLSEKMQIHEPNCAALTSETC